MPQDFRQMDSSMEFESRNASDVEDSGNFRDIERARKPYDRKVNVTTNAAPHGSKEDLDDPGLPPDGGLRAWLQVAGCFFLYFNVWGITSSFGSFQTYYEHNPHWTKSPSDISWIGSVQAFLNLVVGLIAGPLYDLGYFRHLIVLGTSCITVGFMMTSLCDEYWQTMLAQGFLIGTGGGCLLVLAVAILPQYFSSRLGLVSGIAVAGSSIGGIVYPIAFRHLLVQAGFGWATRVLGFIALAGLLFSICVMRPRVKPRGTRQLFQLSAFKETPYMLLTISGFLIFTGFYVPLYYIQTYAITKGITDESLGFQLLPIINAVSVFGRILPALLADHIGPYNVLIPSVFLSGAMCLIWIGINNLGGVIVFCILYGGVSGSFVSMPSVIVASLTKDMRYMGTRWGQFGFALALGFLCGTPISGALYGSTGNFLGLQLFSGLAIILGGIFAVASRISTTGLTVRKKA